MGRQAARDTLFKLVYGYVITKEFEQFSFDTLTEEFGRDDREYIFGCLMGIIDEKETLDALIKKYSQNFAFDRIYKVDLACLYIGAYEILFRDDIPDKVSANEATELAKTYSSDKSYSFVNGILASVIKEKNGEQ